MVKTTDRHSLLFLAGVFLTCMCGLMLQIMETRMLSVIGQYNLAFFAIGVAMLGMTAGALIVFFRFETTYSTARLSEAMARAMCYFAWSVLGSLAVLLNLALVPYFEPTLTYVVAWTLAVLVLLPPYVLLGVAVSLALTRTVNWKYADPSASRAALTHAVASPLKASALGAQILLAFLWGQRFGRVAIGGRVAPGCRRARGPSDGRIRIDRCSRDPTRRVAERARPLAAQPMCHTPACRAPVAQRSGHPWVSVQLGDSCSRSALVEHLR